MNHNSIDDINDDGFCSPEELAWKLIMDENINASSLMAYTDENTKETLFEILITIYIEMIFDYYKLIYLQNTENDSFDDFSLNLNDVDINDLTNVFKEKINKMKYKLTVDEISLHEYENIKKNRYCMVLLKDSPNDATYFEMNKERLDPEKRYHFILNSLFKSQTKLDNIFTTLCINNKYFKISFSEY